MPSHRPSCALIQRTMHTAAKDSTHSPHLRVHGHDAVGLVLRPPAAHAPRADELAVHHLRTVNLRLRQIGKLVSAGDAASAWRRPECGGASLTQAGGAARHFPTDPTPPHLQIWLAALANSHLWINSGGPLRSSLPIHLDGCLGLLPLAERHKSVAARAAGGVVPPAQQVVAGFVGHTGQRDGGGVWVAARPGRQGSMC